MNAADKVMQANSWSQAPGSEEAVKLGCKCPVFDNGQGAGAYGGEGYLIDSGCELHSKKINKKS